MARSPYCPVNPEDYRLIKSFDRTFSKGGRRPHPIRASDAAQSRAKKKSLFFLLAFTGYL
jgi:hypothetical protein